MTSDELRDHKQRLAAREKDFRAIIARDFSASRMSDTKWHKAINAIEGRVSQYRFKLVYQAKPSRWGWLINWEAEHPGYLEQGDIGPFRLVWIEWMEAEPEQGQAEEVAELLQSAGVPFEWHGSYPRIVGYVRGTSDAV